MKREMQIRDEEILLLGLCRLELGDELLDKIRKLSKKVEDWHYFTGLANAHGVAALVYHNLRRYNLLGDIPADEVLFLRKSLMKSLSINTYHTETIRDVTRLLKKEKIKIVLLKGMALELTVYGNCGLRQMSDIDILTTLEQSLKARKILMSNGFASLPVKSSLHKLILPYTGKHLPTLTRKGAALEIHHELFGSRRNILTRMLFDTSYEMSVKGEIVYIPQPRILFLYLIKHLFLHEMNNESQLRLYTDLVVLIEKYHEEIINYGLLETASEAGMSEMLAWRLEPLRDLFGITFPSWIDDFIDKWYNPDSINKFIFFLKSPKDNPHPNKAIFYRHVIGDIPGIHRKLIYLLGDLFPSVSFMKKRYGCRNTLRALFFYPHRTGKILWLLGRRIK